MLHVEVVQNEWSAAQQRVVARVLLNGTGQLRVDSDDPQWASVALHPFTDPTGTEVTPDEPERFLRSLHHHLKGDYVFATEAHEDGDCEFSLGEKLPLKVTAAAESSAETEALA